ncbi:MAG: hypothetical protein KAJ44_01395 [Thermoplasmatales archaeon]|nr:hypothetical protein [Thermoplasmatales archaeon]
MLRQIVERSSIPLRNSYKMNISIYGDDTDVTREYADELHKTILLFHQMTKAKPKKKIRLEYNEDELSF